LKLSIIVTLKKEVLDPQGKVIQQTLFNMGIKDINKVRQGKYFEIEIDEEKSEIAKKKCEELCKRLLANLTIEDFKVINN